MKALLIALTLVFAMVVVPAQADFSVEQYLRYKKLSDAQILIHGMEQGLAWANTGIVVRAGGKFTNDRLFCTPEHLALTLEQTLNILDEEIAFERTKQIHVEEYPVGLILLSGMQRTFPCTK